MSSKSHFFRQGLNLFPLELSPVVYINSEQGVNIDASNNIQSVEDLTGNGYDFIPNANMQVLQSGINGLPSFDFTGSVQLANEDVISEILDLTQRFIWCVFQITVADSGKNYHQPFIQGTISSTVLGSNFMQLFNSNNSNSFNSNYVNNSLDDSITSSQLIPHYSIFDKTSTQVEYTLNGVFSVKNGAYNLNNKNIYLSGIPGNVFAGGKMLISEFGILNYTPTAQQIQDLKNYFQTRYNI
tara:strand:+ start:112 stop:834 length:723 start_codon:yes stop_codon:yes gene_type:complete